MIGIYSFLNIQTGKRYIGQSCHIEKRKDEHFRDTIKLQTKFGRALNQYPKEAFLFEILEECSISELNQREIYWISFYNSFQDGYNMTSGGDVVVDYDKIRAIPTEEVLIAWNEGLSIKGIHTKFNRSSYDAIRNQLMNCGISPEEIKQRGIDRQRISSRNRQVVQKSLNGEIITSYISLNEAARMTGISSQNIGKVCKGSRSTAGGFVWEYGE